MTIMRSPQELVELYDTLKQDILIEYYELINYIRISFQKTEEELIKHNIQYINTIRNDFFGMKLVKDSFYIGAKPDPLNHRIILDIEGELEYIKFTNDVFTSDLRKRILEYIISKETPEIEW